MKMMNEQSNRSYQQTHCLSCLLTAIVHSRHIYSQDCTFVDAVHIWIPDGLDYHNPNYICGRLNRICCKWYNIFEPLLLTKCYYHQSILLQLCIIYHNTRLSKSAWRLVIHYLVRRLIVRFASSGTYQFECWKFLFMQFASCMPNL